MNKHIQPTIERLRSDLNLTYPLNLDNFIARFGNLDIHYNTPKEQVIGGRWRLTPDKEDNHFDIYVEWGEEEKDTPENRFELATELGHLFLGHLSPSHYKYYRRNANELVSDAEDFAASLLMPKDIFRAKLEEYDSHNGVRMEKVADYFGVTKQLATNYGCRVEFLRLTEYN